MPGYEDGNQWTESDGTTHTVNSTSDPRAGEGGYYHTQVSSSGDKATAVYNSDGTMADVAANKGWN